MTLEQTLGSGWTAALHPDDAERVSRVWSRALETGELVEIDYRLRRADGVYRPFLARGKALRDREGQVVKWFGMLTEMDRSSPGGQEAAITGKAPEVDSIPSHFREWEVKRIT
jgi:PAS domain S-box-containing protein